MTNELVKKEELGEQSFIERLVSKAESLEEIKKVGMVIIESGFCPSHFQQTKDAVGVIMCIEAGKKLGLSWIQSLSDIYPVKGRIGIMGTLAKALIMSSGVCESWEDITEGTYPNADYKHIIISKRKGFPKEFRTEFSMFDAKTAGLTDKAIYKTYGKRMCMWRALGFHATDYYNDLLKGFKTVEELQDFDPGLIGGVDKIITKDGKELKINADNQRKSDEITQSLSEKIDKANGKSTESVTDAEIVKQYTVDELTEMKDAIYDLPSVIGMPPAKITLLGGLPGRKSNKQYREAIIAFQEGKLDEWLSAQMSAGKQESSDAIAPTPAPVNITASEATESFHAEREVPESASPLTGNIFITEAPATGKRPFKEQIAAQKEIVKAGITDADAVSIGYKNIIDLYETGKKSDIEALIQKKGLDLSQSDLS